MIDRLTDEQVQGIIDWPVPLGRMSAPVLALEVQASRKLIADLRALHHPDRWGKSCIGCGHDYPCPTIRLIDAAEERA